ncbi:MAG: translation initiation factor IF-3 [Candidatus Woesebacteria bacterium]|nr:translation initiation factor IF-3 [Candidatus Woesebacteria bacterium]
MGKTNTFWRTDYQIRASSLRVIGSDGKLIGVLSKDEAIKKAKALNLTLVEIAPNATPPVAKIVDFGKFRYAEEKKLRAQQKKVKGGEVKEIRFSPFIAENDFKVRVTFLGKHLITVISFISKKSAKIQPAQEKK